MYHVDIAFAWATTTCSLDGQTGHYQPYGKDWIKKGIYELLHKVRMAFNSHKLYRSTRAVVRLRAQHSRCAVIVRFDAASGNPMSTIGGG